MMFAQPPIDTGDAATWVLFILSGGFAVGIYTLVKASVLWRGSVETSEAAAIARIDTWAKECAENLRIERLWRTYWERIASHRERALITAGVDVPRLPPPPLQSVDDYG